MNKPTRTSFAVTVLCCQAVAEQNHQQAALVDGPSWRCTGRSVGQALTDTFALTWSHRCWECGASLMTGLEGMEGEGTHLNLSPSLACRIHPVLLASIPPRPNMPHTDPCRCPVSTHGIAPMALQKAAQAPWKEGRQTTFSDDLWHRPRQRPWDLPNFVKEREPFREECTFAKLP